MKPSSYINTKTKKSQTAPLFSRAFTIVELLIVVVVVAILAAITIVAYNGIQKNAINATVQTALSNASTAMKVQAIQTENFATIPDNVNPPEKVGLALTELPPPQTTNTAFCMNGTYLGHNDVAYHITEAGSPETGLCDGDILPDTIVGQYNYEAAGGADPDVIQNLINAVTLEGDLYGFKVATNKAWDEVTLSWGAQEGVARYEIQTRQNTLSGYANSTWYYRSLSSGSGQESGAGTVGYSGQVPSGTTSLVWTDKTRSVPFAAGQEYHYRLRPCTGASASTCSAWTTISLPNPVQANSNVPEIKNLSVTPSSNWSNVTLSWKRVDNFSTDMPNTRYEVQTRQSTISGNSSSNWRYRSIDDGSGDQSGAGTVGYSGQVPIDTTSLVWTDKTKSVPYAVGQTYYYRVRTCANGSSTYCSGWSEVSLANPVQSNADLPDITGFTVNPSGNWSSVNLAWNAVANYSTDMQNTRYEIQTRQSTISGNSSSNWRYRSIDDGSGDQSGAGTVGYSGQVPIGTTSLTWTDKTRSVPYAVGQTYYYRIRTCANGGSNYCGNWSEVSLANPVQSNSDLPDITGFSVTPSSGWTNVTISWNGVPNYSVDMTNTRYEVQTRQSTTAGHANATWYYRLITDGSGQQSGAGTVGYSGQVPIGTTSLVWTDKTRSVPSAGQTYHYRIRTCASGGSNYCGNWNTLSLPYSD